MSALSEVILPCAACAPKDEQMAAILSLLLRQSGEKTAAQTSVAVNGDDVTLLAASDTYRCVRIQNTGNEHVYLKLGTGAVNTGAGGEIVLHKSGGSYHGDGGVYDVCGYQGVITAASTGATNVSVTVLT